MRLLTSQSSLSLSIRFSVYVTTLITFFSVCMFVCERVCLRTYSESLNMCSFESLSLSLCLSLCFISLSACCLGKDDTLFFHIYLSIFPPNFCLSSRCFFCPGIRAIRVHSLRGLDAICRMISELMLHFCTIPRSNWLVKTGFPLFSAVRSHREWPDRRLREASVLYFNILICLRCLYYTTLKEELSEVLMHYRCRRNA